MKKCVLASGELLVNEQGERMFSGCGNRKYQSTGAVTTTLSIVVRSNSERCVESFSTPVNIPRGAIGSVFSEDKAELRVFSFKSILRIDDLKCVDTLRNETAGIMENIKAFYNTKEDIQFQLKGKYLKLDDLAAAKQAIREKNNSIRGSIEGVILSKLKTNSNNLQAQRLINRAYLSKKLSLSPVSVVINTQLSHNIYGQNYAVSNVDITKLKLDNYICNNGTYRANKEKGNIFSIPCNSIEHAKVVLNTISVILNRLYTALDKVGFERLVDTTQRTDQQVQNDNEIVEGSRTPEGLALRSAKAIDNVEDNTTVSDIEVLKSLNLDVKHNVKDMHLFDEPLG